MKSGRTIITVLGFLAAAAAGPARAADDSGIYLGGQIGYVEYQDVCDRTVGVTCDEKDTGYRVFAGYQFSRHWAVELAVVDLGEATGNGAAGNFRYKSSGIDGALIGTIPLAAGFSILGRLGAYRVRTVLEQQGLVIDPFTSGAKTSSGFVYGAGLGYTLWHIGLRAEWQRYENIGGTAPGQDDVNMYSLGALIRF